MKLILLRHAKSAWDNPLLDDHDRTLNARGRAAASEMGAWLRARGHVPGHIFCSSAARTQETCSRLDLEAQVTITESLYLAGPETIARHARADHESLLIIAHNPGIAEAAFNFCDTPPTDPDFGHFPTCACAVFSFAAEPSWGTGTLVDFTIPRRLP